MFDMRGLLRLILTTAHSDRKIGKLAVCSYTTVARYRGLAQEAELTFADVERMTEPELRTLFRPGQGTASARKIQPDWAWVALEVKAGRHLREVHEVYETEVGKENSISYKSLRKQHKDRVAASHPIMRQRHKPGEAMMVDFAGYRPQGRGDVDAQPLEFELFVAVLPASDYTFACAVRSQKTADWLEANERALRFFDGAPETIISDNLKAAVTTPRRRSAAVINPAFQAFCDHHGVRPCPAGAYRPTQKAKVEIGVKLVQRLLRLALHDRPLQGLEAINDILLDVVARLNAKALRRAPGQSRQSLFQLLDQPALRPLRQDAFAYYEVRRGLKLGPDYHVPHDHRFYSAPHTLIGRQLDLRANATAVELWHDARMVAVHPRLATAGECSTDPAHMPPNHLARRAAVEEDLLLWSRLQGPNIQAVAEAEAARPLHGAAKSSLYRSFRDLHRRVGSKRLEAACARAVRSDHLRLGHVRNILDRGLEFTDPADFLTPDTPPVSNENVRGADYFTGT